MRKFCICLLAVIMIISTSTVSLAASPYSIMIERTVYRPGTHMTIQVDASTDELFTIEILKDTKTMMSLPASGTKTTLDVLIPLSWEDGSYVLRAGRGTEYASVNFEINAFPLNDIFLLSLDKTTVRVGDTLILKGGSNIVNSTVLYCITASSGNFTPKTGEVTIRNNRFECFVPITSDYTVGNYSVYVGNYDFFSNTCSFAVESTPKVKPIVASPPLSSISAGTKITLSTPTENAAIYYTLDGTTPTSSSTLYTSSGITINSTTMLKAIAIRARYENSDILTQTYTVAVVGGGGGGAAQPASTIPADGGAVSVDYTQSGGTVTLVLPGSKVTEVISGAANGTASLDLSGVSGATDAVLPIAAVKQLAGAGLATKILLPWGSVSLNAGAAASSAAQAGGSDISISLKAVAQSTLSAEQRKVIKSGDLVVQISVLSGTQAIHNFDGTITVKLPYTGQLPVAAWYLSDAGTLEKYDCIYDAAAKTATFTTNHLSVYVVGKDDSPKNPFGDVAGTDWFCEHVTYVHEKGLMKGISTEPMLFDPSGTLTRGMVVTVLYRMAGSPNVSGIDNTFDDLAGGNFYTDAVKWAAANGIVKGYGSGKFGPNDNVTREQLAAIIYEYERFSGKIPANTLQAGAFADQDKINTWAKTAANELAAQGIISGKPGGMFDPGGTATRAEFAAVLHRFQEAKMS